MDGAQVLREVRRHTGLSQRALAARSGVALSTITAVEAGRRPPSIPVLTAVLAVAGLELAVERVVLPVPEATVVHLRRSLVQRLHLACGGSGRVRPGRQPLAWTQLLALAARTPVHLHGSAARAIWLGGEPPSPFEVCAAAPAARGADLPAPRSGPASALTVRPACGRHGPAPVELAVGPRRVRVDSPAALALDEEHSDRRHELRAVARLLHRHAALDESGRRPRAHGDPQHQSERERVFHTKRYHRLDLPPSDDTRSWRLDDDASLGAWLRRYDYPD